VVSPTESVPVRRRKPSRPRTQGASISTDIGATEDDGLRSVGGRAEGCRICRSDH
jgi:hypothetical protein